ncbi:MAG: COX15/CtaA family protein, partial [Propionicimonas sp.]|nr:COX15/CtaA family protein [Propionicimonas sp.]
MDLVSSPTALRRWTVASLVANMGLIVTGGLVRVTGSGLGCSTWPQCEPGSYLPHPEAGVHAVVEFGNRLLTFVLVAIAVGTFVAAWRARDETGRPRRDLRALAFVAAVGIPAQAVIGGWSVLSSLNPWVVSLHLLASVAIILVCVVLIHRAFGLEPAIVPPVVAWLARAVFGLGMLVVVLGTEVTGAGPNSGDGG